jgi:hypothetical protein
LLIAVSLSLAFAVVENRVWPSLIPSTLFIVCGILMFYEFFYRPLGTKYSGNGEGINICYKGEDNFIGWADVEHVIYRGQKILVIGYDSSARHLSACCLAG